MPKDVTAKKAKIESVIDDYGTSVTFTVQSPDTYSEDTGWSKTSGGTTVTNVISYDYFTFNQNFQPMGNVKEGDIRLIAKAGVTIQNGYTFTYDSKSFEVTGINKLDLAGVTLAQVVTATEILSEA